MREEDLVVLSHLASQVPLNGTIVEIGSFLGRSSWALAKSAPTARVYCIDLWNFRPGDEYHSQEKMAAYHPGLKLSYDTFLKNIRDCPNIHPIQANSADVPWNLPIDLAFIDGDHFSPQVDLDLSLWSKRLTPQGILLGHDFNFLQFPDVVRAVLRTADELHLPLKLYKNSDIWLIEMDPRPDEGDLITLNPVLRDFIEETMRVMYET